MKLYIIFLISLLAWSKFINLSTILLLPMRPRQRLVNTLVQHGPAVLILIKSVFISRYQRVK